MHLEHVLDRLPDIETNEPDPRITAALKHFASQCDRDQLGPQPVEEKLSFIVGNNVVLRSPWGDVVGRLPLSEIPIPPTQNQYLPTLTN